MRGLSVLSCRYPQQGLRYTLTIGATGFGSQRKLDLVVDSDSAICVDATLQIVSQADTVTVTSEGGVQEDTVATHLGEVVTAKQMTAIPLNGRSYTDLLAIQPGVAPISTLLPSSVIMAGVTGGIDLSTMRTIALGVVCYQREEEPKGDLT